jgi:hypothetical protein
MNPRRTKLCEFTERNGETHAAIIRRVNKNGTVDLTVFRHTTETYYLDVPYSETYKPLHWNWPLPESMPELKPTDPFQK